MSANGHGSSGHGANLGGLATVPGLELAPSACRDVLGIDLVDCVEV